MKTQEIIVKKVWFKEFLTKNKEMRKMFELEFLTLSNIGKSDEVYIIHHNITKERKEGETVIGITFSQKAYMTDLKLVYDVTPFLLWGTLSGLKWQNLTEYPTEVYDVISNYVYGDRKAQSEFKKLSKMYEDARQNQEND